MAKTIKYQYPSFDKKKYWLDRKASFEDRRAARVAKRYHNLVAVHDKPDWPKKEPSAKALRRQTKRGRKVISYAS